ncbi:hypothetical protein G6F46_001866 [Rhizopus delemar]|uniref:Reverse transcriptase domain-containing protein n=2 Tax=Rhizopus TaxID=4842 RepID=A0A9P6Z8N1_9FUNG|nr:hypothetical protein G6F36_012562 [Rhizopus arrhizus]KAG1466337.1 hypothetical protein G6F55_000546 [Rhizopus delemar]KAG1496780.1 hypothetical protein G6F54_006233 [Rhizopus delemar]KAG1517268.1 hypothetical protein G6F53_001509 [Rhizopus delemar]KAG1528172.1 hypothetical protein G6F52_000884 [Rhizopus delemar]
MIGFVPTTLSACKQSCGLQQGDPLSPPLFNIATEPSLRSVRFSTPLPSFQVHVIDIRNLRYLFLNP